MEEAEHESLDDGIDKIRGSIHSIVIENSSEEAKYHSREHPVDRWKRQEEEERLK